MTLETEFKLGFASKEEMQLVWDQEWFQDLLIPDSLKTEEYVTYYFDTEDLLLRGQRANIRIRSISQGGFVHTVKIGKPGRDGLHQRLEWNLETDQSDFDPEFFVKNAISDGDPEDTLTELISSVEGKSLREICRTEFTRTLSLAGFGDSLVEVCMDTGYLVAAEAREALCEMEIELKKGDVRDVIALGEEIELRSSATRNSRSKFARCMDIMSIS